MAHSPSIKENGHCASARITHKTSNVASVPMYLIYQQQRMWLTPSPCFPMTSPTGIFQLPRWAIRSLCYPQFYRMDSNGIQLLCQVFVIGWREGTEPGVFITVSMSGWEGACSSVL